MAKTYGTSHESMEDLKLAAIAWEQAKEDERKATQTRREIEDWLAKEAFALAEDFDGTAHYDADAYEIKVVGRMTRKIDEDKLQNLAREYGLVDVLPSLFKFKPELKLTAWKQASSDITGRLAGAIETKPGRPSFEIIKKEAE